MTGWALNQRMVEKSLMTSLFGLKFFLEVAMPNIRHIAEQNSKFPQKFAYCCKFWSKIFIGFAKRANFSKPIK
jgi:hypothetical protein